MSYSKLISEALVAGRSRSGTSLQKIKSFISETYPDLTFRNHFLRAALKKGVEDGSLLQKNMSYKLARMPTKKSSVQAQGKAPAPAAAAETAAATIATTPKKAAPKKAASKKAVTKPNEKDKKKAASETAVSSGKKAAASDSGKALSVKVEVIVTYEEKDQEFFTIVLPLKMSADALDIEKEWVHSICLAIRDPSDLVKLSLCCLGLGKMSSDVKKKVNGICDRCDLKYYFRPDQREEVENYVIKQLPKVAKKTTSF